MPSMQAIDPSHIVPYHPKSFHMISFHPDINPILGIISKNALRQSKAITHPVSEHHPNASFYRHDYDS